MVTETHKLISDLLDGEASDGDLLRGVERLSSDPEFKSCWGRLVLVRECLRQELPRYSNLGFQQRVAEALADEPAILAPGKRGVGGSRGIERARRFLKPAAGIAVAASVAVVAILGIRVGQNGGVDSLETQTPTPMTARSIPEFRVRSDSGVDVQFAEAEMSTPLVRPVPAQNRAWLNEYVLRHSNAGGFAGGAGFTSYVPVVTAAHPDQQWSQDQSESWSNVERQ